MGTDPIRDYCERMDRCYRCDETQMSPDVLERELHAVLAPAAGTGWTAERPTKPGYYWYKRVQRERLGETTEWRPTGELGTPEILNVYMGRYGYLVVDDDDRDWNDSKLAGYDDPGGEWLGPLAPAPAVSEEGVRRAAVACMELVAKESWTKTARRRTAAAFEREIRSALGR